MALFSPMSSWNRSARRMTSQSYAEPATPGPGGSSRRRSLNRPRPPWRWSPLAERSNAGRSRGSRTDNPQAARFDFSSAGDGDGPARTVCAAAHGWGHGASCPATGFRVNGGMKAQAALRARQTGQRRRPLGERGVVADDAQRKCARPCARSRSLSSARDLQAAVASSGHGGVLLRRLDQWRRSPD